MGFDARTGKRLWIPHDRRTHDPVAIRGPKRRQFHRNTAFGSHQRDLQRGLVYLPVRLPPASSSADTGRRQPYSADCVLDARRPRRWTSSRHQDIWTTTLGGPRSADINVTAGELRRGQYHAGLHLCLRRVNGVPVGPSSKGPAAKRCSREPLRPRSHADIAGTLRAPGRFRGT